MTDRWSSCLPPREEYAAPTQRERDRIINKRKADTLEAAKRQREADQRSDEEYWRKYGD